MVFTYWTKERAGWESEIDKIKEMSASIGCEEPIVFQDASKAESIEKLEKVAEKLNDEDKYSSLILFVIGHGGTEKNSGKQYIENVDNEIIPFDIFFDSFTNENIPNFAGNPRLIFVQSCRGEELNESVELQADESRSRIRNAYPNISDFFLLMSSVENVKSFRKKTDGGVFIQELCNAISKHGQHQLEDIVKFVNRQMLRIENDINPSSQISAIAHGTLTKRFSFVKTQQLKGQTNKKTYEPSEKRVANRTKVASNASGIKFFSSSDKAFFKNACVVLFLIFLAFQVPSKPISKLLLFSIVSMDIYFFLPKLPQILVNFFVGFLLPIFMKTFYFNFLLFILCDKVFQCSLAEETVGFIASSLLIYNLIKQIRSYRPKFRWLKSILVAKIEGRYNSQILAFWPNMSFFTYLSQIHFYPKEILSVFDRWSARSANA